MFRSFASSLISFVAILLFAFVFLFLWSGSEGIQFKRVAMEGDRSTAQILEEYRRKNMARYEPSEDTGPAVEAPKENRGDGPPVVIWVSVPGFRGDYIEKAETPFFDKLAEAGGSTNKMRPSFPCLTFPAHATMATGVTPDKHGIVADRIRVAAGEVIVEPTDQSLLQAEPIWTTATRQGIKTLVHDWPLSQEQPVENAAAAFLESFDPEAGDTQRLDKALEAWRKASGGAAPAEETASADDEAATEGEDAADSPAVDDSESAPEAAAEDDKVRLVMLRLTDILKAGLVNGPRADETYAAVTATDAALQAFFDTVQAEWESLAPANANLVMFVTTDHGMAEVDKNVNIEHLLGEEMTANADIVAHDAIANLYFKDLPESEGEKKIFLDKFDGELSKRIYFRTLKKEELPADWSYEHERTGDRVLVLKTSYAFADERSDEPVFDPADGPGFFGGYGYPVEESIRMSGQILLSGFPNSPATGSLGEIGQPSFHATVCKILGIEPAEGASTETLGIE
ncbi:MAG: nucleotide pyrophosphatase/phosphodiesterase family protein [Verrucomicrobiales bacterium]